MKVDLDNALISVQLSDMPKREERELISIIQELRAAREVIEEAKGHVDTAFILQKVLKEYNEATKW